METSIIQRIKCVIEMNNMSITALSKKIGVIQQTLNRQISGESAMPLSTIDKFLSCFPEVSAEWLLRGEGSMIKGESGLLQGEDESKEVTFYVNKDGFLKLKR